MAFRVQFGQNRLDGSFVARLGGADEIVVGEAQIRGKCLPGGRQLIAISLGRFALGLGDLLHLLAVFIRARQKKHLFTQGALGPGHYVRDNLLVGVAQVRLAIHIVNGGRQIKSLTHAQRSVPEGPLLSNRRPLAVKRGA